MLEHEDGEYIRSIEYGDRDIPWGDGQRYMSVLWSPLHMLAVEASAMMDGMLKALTKVSSVRTVACLRRPLSCPL